MRERIAKFCSYYVCAQSCCIRQVQTWSFSSLRFCLVRRKLGLQMFLRIAELGSCCFLFLVCWLNLRSGDFAILPLYGDRSFDLVITWIPSLADLLFTKTSADCTQNPADLPATMVYSVVQMRQSTRMPAAKALPFLYLNVPNHCSWIRELGVC